MSGIEQVELVLLLLLLFIVVFGLLAQRLRTPYPIVMVIGGLLLSFIPGIPRLALNPDIVFLAVLPPLLYAAAWTTSWREFRYNLISISLLAFGLVAFTVVAIALIAPSIFDGFDWRLGFVLGAVVAPTDAIAATAIARRVGLPARIVHVLEGESLINDATGLLALQFAIAIVVQKAIPTVSSGILIFLWLVAGGVGLGLVVGLIIEYFERRIDDGPIEIALSVLVPYTVYLAAEEFHSSGVLAVVTCGLFLSRRSARFFSPSVRIQIWSVWKSLNFVLNGFVFVLIGFQLPAIRASIGEYTRPTLMIDAIVFSSIVILLRIVWVFPGAGVAWLMRTRIAHQDETPPRLREIFVIGWTGMRGVVSLAATLSLPALVADGSPFPQRNLIVFLTFCVILVTLVLQGLTLPRLINVLGLSQASGQDCEETEARRIVIEAAIFHLENVRKKDTNEFAAIYDDLIRHYHQRLISLQPRDDGQNELADYDRQIELSLEALRVEREAAIRLRDEGRINDEVLRSIERELDLNESRIAAIGDA